MTGRTAATLRRQIACLLIAAGAGWSPGAADAAATLEPTALVLKDGRIARVSVHSFAFAAGADALEDTESRALETLAEAIATDCYLTSQVVGHADPDEQTNGPNGAHALARARADGIQRVLAGHGLPIDTIASVWDWQFLNDTPGATLWVFRQAEGEACEGAPLAVAEASPPPDSGSSAPAPAARPEQPAGAPRSAARSSALAEVDAALGAGPDSSIAAEAAEADAREAARRDAANAEAAERAAEAEAEAVAAEAAEERAAAEEAEARREAEAEAEAADARRAALAAAAAEQRAAAAEAEAEVAAREAETGADAPAEDAVAPDPLAIRFATNSSLLPEDAAPRLETLIESLPPGTRWRVRLEASGGASDDVENAESDVESKRYNRWLGERRIDRVRGWIDVHGNGRAFDYERTFSNDDDRLVTVTLTPGGESGS